MTFAEQQQLQPHVVISVQITAGRLDAFPQILRRPDVGRGPAEARDAAAQDSSAACGGGGSHLGIPFRASADDAPLLSDLPCCYISFHLASGLRRNP